MVQKLEFPKAMILICKKRSWSSKSYGNALRNFFGADGDVQYINFPTATISPAATDEREKFSANSEHGRSLRFNRGHEEYF